MLFGVLSVFEDTDPSRRISGIGVYSLSPGNDSETDCARDTEGVDGADGINELARDNVGVRGSVEFARDREGVRGRSRSGAGGATVHPKRDVRMAFSEGRTSGAGGDNCERLVVGIRGGASSEMGSVGMITEENVERNVFNCVGVWSGCLDHFITL